MRRRTELLEREEDCFGAGRSEDEKGRGRHAGPAQGHTLVLTQAGRRRPRPPLCPLTPSPPGFTAWTPLAAEGLSQVGLSCPRAFAPASPWSCSHSASLPPQAPPSWPPGPRCPPHPHPRQTCWVFFVPLLLACGRGGGDGWVGLPEAPWKDWEPLGLRLRSQLSGGVPYRPGWSQGVGSGSAPVGCPLRCPDPGASRRGTPGAACLWVWAQDPSPQPRGAHSGYTGRQASSRGSCCSSSHSSSPSLPPSAPAVRPLPPAAPATPSALTAVSHPRQGPLGPRPVFQESESQLVLRG